jgi:hypothetical protein
MAAFAIARLHYKGTQVLLALMICRVDCGWSEIPLQWNSSTGYPLEWNSSRYGVEWSGSRPDPVLQWNSSSRAKPSSDWLSALAEPCRSFRLVEFSDTSALEKSTTRRLTSSYTINP